MAVKICIACQKEKSIDEYCRDKYVKGGFKHKCKDCVRHKRKMYTPQKGFKVCTTCKKEVIIDNFYKSQSGKFGVVSTCKECSEKRRIRNKEKYKKWYIRNREHLLKKGKENYIANKQAYIDRANKYYSLNKENVKSYKKKWIDKNKDRINNKIAQRKKEDPLFKLRHLYYSRIKACLNRYLVSKKGDKTIDILGCSMEKFKEHIERQFESWMSWDNHGSCDTNEYNCSWDLDHIIPLSYAKNEKAMYVLNHWSNFQPLCSKINRHHKKDKVPKLTNLELGLTTYQIFNQRNKQ